MGLFSRISEIINSNVNAMLDKAEDPEKMVKLMISEMEDTLMEVKSCAAGIVADRIRLEREIARYRARSAEWDEKATLAIEKGRDDLARLAVEEKLNFATKADARQHELEENQALLAQVQGDIGRLESKLKDVQQRQGVLIANHKSLVNRRKVEEKIYAVNTSGAFSRFEDYEQRMDRMEAETDMLSEQNRSLDKEFEDMEREARVEQALKELKEKVKAKAAKSSAAS